MQSQSSDNLSLFDTQSIKSFNIDEQNAFFPISTPINQIYQYPQGIQSSLQVINISTSPNDQLISPNTQQDNRLRKNSSSKNKKDSKKHPINPNKKNNQPKYIMKNFCKLLRDFKDYYIIDESDLNLFYKTLQKAQKFYSQKILLKNHVSLNDLYEFFGVKKQSENSEIRQSFLNRRALFKILKSVIKKDIIQNNMLVFKKKYLISVKSYLLRLRWAALTGRIQCQ